MPGRTPAAHTLNRPSYPVVKTLAAAAGILALAMALGLYLGVPGPVVIATIGAAGLGALVGISELVSRYTDSPERALFAWAGLLYIAVNILAAGTAFGLAHGFDLLKLSAQSLPARLLTEALVSGLGAMAFFRSAVFTVRVGGSDVAVGPASVLQLILNAVDRAVDRERARPRAEFISRLMNGISFNAAADVLPRFCFSAMQNVSAADQQALLDWIKVIRSDSETDDDQKSLLLGLRLLNIVGDKVLESTITGLGPRIRLSLKIGLGTLTLLNQIRFETSASPLIAICYALAQGSIAVDREELEQRVAAIGRQHFDDGVDNSVKVLLLASELLKAFGDDVVGRAVAVIAPGLPAQPAPAAPPPATPAPAAATTAAPTTATPLPATPPPAATAPAVPPPQTPAPAAPPSVAPTTAAPASATPSPATSAPATPPTAAPPPAAPRPSTQPSATPSSAPPPQAPEDPEH